MSEKYLNWAVLGTGVIANQMAAALEKMGRRLYAVGNRTHDKAVAFAEKYGVEKVYDTIDDMFLDEAVDISIQEKELEQMDVILKIIAVMIVVIGAISGAGICLLWQKRKKK